MAELDELCKFLNLNPSDSIDEIKKTFNESFVKADPMAIKQNEALYSQLLAESNKVILSKVKGLAETIGVELTKDLTEGKKTAEIVEFLTEKSKEVTGGYQSKLTDLEKAVKEAQKSGASAKDIEKAQREVEEWKAKHDEINGLLQSTAGQFEEYKGQVEKEKEQFVISQHKQSQVGAVKLKFASEFERKGFLSEIDSRYQLAKDGDNILVRDKEGKQIPNPDKAGAFMSYSEVLQMEAKKANYLDDNPHNGKPIIKPATPAIPAAQVNVGKPSRVSKTSPFLNT